MKAAIVTAKGQTPIYADFPIPTAKDDELLITVRASALSHFTRGRASGEHYSATGAFPFIAGADGVGTTPDDRRVYFVLPDAPNGALAELCPIDARRCISLPDTIDDITAAALGNPGMSAWAALVERAHLQPGETILINGATSTAGRIAIQLAKHLGAGKIIATGRNTSELEDLKSIGADITISTTGTEAFEETLKQTLATGIDVVIDYLWGTSAKTIIVAIAKTAEDGHPIRFVHVGGASGEATVDIPGAALRASGLMLMGSGVGSLGRRQLLKSIQSIFDIAAAANFKIATKTVPLSQVAETWNTAAGKPRLVYTIP